MLSSHKCQSPSMRINAIGPFFGNIASEKPIVVGVNGARPRDRLLCRVGDEELLPGNAIDLASMGLIDLGSMGLKPIPVTLKASILRMGLRQVRCVGNFVHRKWNLLHLSHETPPLDG